jgi:hypothetical protein
MNEAETEAWPPIRPHRAPFPQRTGRKANNFKALTLEFFRRPDAKPQQQRPLAFLPLLWGKGAEGG